MQHTLLNPNQLQSFGMLVKDDPFALEEPICIESENGDDVLPLHTEGTVIYLDTWTPTDEDLSQFPHIIMTSPHPWNPRDIQFPKTSRRMEEELTIRSIFIVEILWSVVTNAIERIVNSSSIRHEVLGN